MSLVTQAEFARIAGVNRSTVSRWIQNGRIQADAQGLIDPVAAQRMRDATESPEPHHQARKAQFDDARSGQASSNTATPPATGPQDGPNGPTARFNAAQGAEPMPQAEKLGIALKLETYKLQKSKAETAAVELDKLIGTLVDRAEVDFVLADFGNTFRALLENLPDRLAGQLAALRGDTNAMHQALEEALNQVLLDMAEHMKRKTEGLNP